MKTQKTLSYLLILLLTASCSLFKEKSRNDNWKWLAFLFQNSGSANQYKINVSLIGQEGRPMSVSNVSTKEVGSLSESASAAEDSSVSPAGSGESKPGGETLDIKFDGRAKALEVHDSNGGYAGTITVTPRTGNETYTNSFLSFSLKSDSEPAAGAISGKIISENILVDVPFSDLSKLTPIFSHDGASVNVPVTTGLKPVVTGRDVNNFTSPVKYTVLAKDGTKKEYIVTVNKIQYTCELAGIYFTDYPLTSVVQKSDATNTWFEAALPPNVSLAGLKTSFSVYGTSMTVSGVTQVSGVSSQNFTSAVTFTAHGSNGCTQNYVVKASLEALKAGNKSFAGGKSTVGTRGTLDLVDIPEVTKVDAIGIPKTISVIENKAFGYFDDVKGEYIFTKGQVKLMVPWGSNFENINLVMEVKNNAKKVLLDGSDYVKGSTIAKFTQRNGNEKYSVDVVLTDIYSAFEVPYEIQIVLGAPPPFLAVSKDANFMLFVNSNAASARDEKKDLEALIKSFAPEKLGEIWDLATLIGYINESKIDVARWTIDPGKMELNVIGKGFQNFEMDFDGYNKEYRCYYFKARYEVYTILRSKATNDNQKYALDEEYKGVHRELCGQTKTYTAFPNFPKTPPSIAGYGEINPNLSSLDGYDVTRGQYELISKDIAFLSLNYLGYSMNQDLSSFTLKTKKGATHTYSLPAPNYMEFSPKEGTVGTEVTVSFVSPTNPATYTLNLSMDKIPVLNPVYKYNDKGFITGATFNVPYISKGTRIVCERLPIGGKGEKFIFYSTESLQFKPYKELRGLSFAKATVDYTVEVDAPFYYPILESGKVTYYKIVSGNIPIGMGFSRSHAVIFGRSKLAQAPSQVVIEANDGYKKIQTTLTISASLPTAVPAPTLNYSASGYSMLVGKKFIISPVGPKGTNVRYNIDRPMPVGINFDRETGTISGYPTSIMSEMKFNITASNPTGFAKFSLGLQIIADKASYTPPSLSFSSINYSLTRNQSITIPPTVFGSGPYEFSATGLPQGMSIDSQTGILSGTPAVLQEPGDVLITVQNYAGVASSKLLMSVTDTPTSAPTGLTFTNTTYDFTNGMAISTISPTVTGLLTNCTSSPALPTGLSVNSACQISGTPTVDVTNVVYTITGTNASGGTVATITITVGSFPPSNLVFTGTPYSLSHNASTVITPTYSGGIASCASAPALPTGLSVNNSTCAIGGTPTTITGAANYTITATNAFGNTNAVINITVAAVAPSALTYVGSPYNFYQSTASSSGTPTVNGSPVSTCTSAPALPAGLTINGTTCTISGSPSGQQGSISYTITATNGAGNTQATVQIAIGPQPPNNLLYVGDPFALGKNVVSSLVPTLTGTPTSCTSSPTLPTGLIINNTTCAITGTATTLQTAVSYTITASNASGSNNAVISIKIVNFWKQEAYAKIRHFYSSGTRLGQSVSISGDTIVVGASTEASNQTTIINGSTGPSAGGLGDVGAAAIYKRTGTIWAQEAYLVASNRDQNDDYGNSSAIDGNTVAIGAYGEDSNQTTITNGTTSPVDNSVSRTGAVYVYKRTGVTWAQEAYIKPANAILDGSFGRAVALSGDTLAIVGQDTSSQTTITNGTTAPTDNSGSFYGAVYVYKRTGVNWAQEAYIRTSQLGLGGGYSVSLDGDTIAVGNGYDASNQTTITNGTTSSSDTSISQSGAVHVFKRTGVNWAQEAYIKPSVNYVNLFFGSNVSLSGDTLAVSANSKSLQTTISSTESVDQSGTDVGAVYIYKRTGSNWASEAYIKAPNAESVDQFGMSYNNMSLSGDSLLVGARLEDCGISTIINSQAIPPDNSYVNSGAVYSFQRNGTTWEWESFLKAPNGGSQLAQFGDKVFLSGDTVVVGSPNEKSIQTTISNGTTASSDTTRDRSGAAYIFRKQ